MQEASLGVSYADDWWLSGGLQPSVTFAFELAGQADGGAELGSVCELGMEPTQSLGQLGDWEFVASLPVKVGLSLDGYFEQPDGGGDDAFGYASCGLALAAILESRVLMSWSDSASWGTTSSSVDSDARTAAFAFAMLDANSSCTCLSRAAVATEVLRSASPAR